MGDTIKTNFSQSNVGISLTYKNYFLRPINMTNNSGIMLSAKNRPVKRYVINKWYDELEIYGYLMMGKELDQSPTNFGFQASVKNQFVSYGFGGSLKKWLNDSDVTQGLFVGGSLGFHFYKNAQAGNTSINYIDLGLNTGYSHKITEAFYIEPMFSFSQPVFVSGSDNKQTFLVENLGTGISAHITATYLISSW